MNHGEHQESVEQASQPKLCAKGCGFFANPACSDMCSKCYRETVSQQERTAANNAVAAAAVAQATQAAAPPQPFQLDDATATPSVAAEPAPASPAPPVLESPEAVASSSAANADGSSPPQKNANRCQECNKRVGLTGFKCRCGYIYCSAHRYAEKHNCSFDYKAMERQKLAKNNPLVQASKVDKF